MDNTLLQALTNCYQNSSSLVLIMNLRWEILWSNRDSSGITDLPQQLKISRNHVENSSHQFYYADAMHDCRLLCNLTDGYRIAEITPLSEQQPYLRMDVDAVTASVQSITTACRILHNALKNDRRGREQDKVMNLIIGSCFRLYRTAYLQKQLDRLHRNERSEQTFSLLHTLKIACEKIDEILYSCVAIETDFPEEDRYLCGDSDEFVMAMLAAVVLCCSDCTNMQTLSISMEQLEDTTCITFCAVDTGAELLKDHTKLEDISAGDCEGEKALLASFCKHYQGSMILSGSARTNERKCILKFKTDASAHGSLTLRSPREMQEQDFYNKYEIMLSCIYYQDLF